MDYTNLEKQIFILGKSFTLVGPKGDIYLESHLDNGAPAEQDIVNILAASISEEDWVIDVGANIGYVSLAMSVLCPRGKIFAFEPGKMAYKSLKRTMSTNGIKNIKISEIGLSDSKSAVTLTYGLSNLSGAFVGTSNYPGHGSDTITLSRLDDEYGKLGITKCSIIKVDIEGHEPNFLRGASKFIEKFKPQAIIEANHWCLNIHNRTSLPDFIDLAYTYFPYIFAFHDGDYLNLGDESARYRFYYENGVNHRYENIYCGFDQNLMICRLNLAFGGWDKTRKLLDSREQALEEQVHTLEENVTALKNSRPQKFAAKINKIIGR